MLKPDIELSNDYVNNLVVFIAVGVFCSRMAGSVKPWTQFLPYRTGSLLNVGSIVEWVKGVPCDTIWSLNIRNASWLRCRRGKRFATYICCTTSSTVAFFDCNRGNASSVAPTIKWDILSPIHVLNSSNLQSTPAARCPWSNLQSTPAARCPWSNLQSTPAARCPW